MLNLGQILYTNLFERCPATGMQNGDEDSLSFISAGRGILMKKFIAFEPLGISLSNFASLYILPLSRHWYAKRFLIYTD